LLLDILTESLTQDVGLDRIKWTNK